MTWLRDSKRLKPIESKSGRGKKHYRVDFELVASVEGRNLRYEARWKGPEGTEKVGKQVSIAAAFKPGTE